MVADDSASRGLWLGERGALSEVSAGAIIIESSTVTTGWMPRRSAALGFDGKWALHPGQVEPANELFSPRQDDYDRAENILDAYAWFTSEAGGARGAAMLGDEMIDEASRKMALVVAGKGRAAGLSRTDPWTPPAA
jgi:hypothetical protein